MSTPAAPLTWEGRHVPLHEIERHLERVATDCAGRTPDVRAAVLNLIIHTDERGVAAVGEAVRQVSAMHPLRAIVVVGHPDARTSHLDATVQVHCHPRYVAYRQTCAEVVLIHAYGSVARHLSSVAIPLLVPDLPVFFWQAGAPLLGRDVVENLLHTCDRLIIDGCRAQSAAALGRCAALARGDGAALSDLAWARLLPWREMLAEAADACPLAWPSLRAVSVRHAAADWWPGHLFAAWLVDRLAQAAGGAGPVSVVPTPDGLRCLAGGREVRLDVRPADTAVDGGSPLAEVALDLDTGALRLQLDSDGRRVAGFGPALGERPAGNYEPRDPADLLSDELRQFGRDDVFEDAFRLALQFAAR